jgi:steroid 5-alpha reductase family enzyme
MSYFVTLGIILFLYMNFWFVVSLLTKRNDVADVAWGLGFVLLAWASFFIGETNGIIGIIVTLLVTVWGLRLAWHVHSRNKGKAEDYRYLAWRKEWGKWFYPRSYAQVYMLQGALLFLIALPVLVINKNFGGDLNILVMLGIAVWIVGFFFEVVGDWQLARFIKNEANKGKLMTRGLWRYTRHPNYFGEVTLWWGIWLVALSVPYGWLTIIGPLTITVLILKVSGIPMLEKKMAEHPDFAEYKKKTSVFIPWFRKNV